MSLHKLGMILTLGLLMSCQETRDEPLWNLSRTILDEEGNPIQGVRIDVLAVRSPHNLFRDFIGMPSRTSKDLTSDATGSFVVSERASLLRLMLSKTGYIPKQFDFLLSRSSSLKEVNIQTTIVLRRTIEMPPQDDLDAFFPSNVIVHIDFATAVGTCFFISPTITSNASTNVYGRMNLQIENSKLLVSFPLSIGAVRISERQTGLTIESWEKNEYVAPETVGQKKYMFPLDSYGECLGNEWAFFVKNSNNYVRVWAEQLDSHSFFVRYKLSRDRFFTLGKPVQTNSI